MLLLENGKRYDGSLVIGNYTCGELVFQTGMTGYIEALTDPSYQGQVLVFTYPMVGNYRIYVEMMESSNVQVKGVIVKDADSYLIEFLKKNSIPLLTGVDTRALTIELREQGTMRCELWDGVSEKCDNNIIQKCTYTRFYGNPMVAAKHIFVLDCGIKNSQITFLEKVGFRLTIVSQDTDFLSLFDSVEKLDGIFISNGPGDPKDKQDTVNQLRQIMQRYPRLPIFGICFGHQLLALASGNDTRKMKYGNRGQNIPVRLLDSERGYITTQNHGYEVILQENSEFKSLFTNLNDGSNEGMYHINKPIFSVQFHPEAKPGPWDCEYLFTLFKQLVDDPNEKIIKLFEKFRSAPRSTQTKRNKVLVLGSGGLTIGQAGEFDYSGSQALKGYKEEGVRTILVNPNIATVQTTTGIGLADKIYSVPITPEYVTEIIKEESPDCIAVSYGGQTALNCGIELWKNGVLEKYNVEILGTAIQNVIDSEDRGLFKKRLDAIPGARVAKSLTTSNLDEATLFAEQVGYPVLVRSGFALGGLGSGFANSPDELASLMDSHEEKIIDKSLRGWREIEYEIVRDCYGNCITVCNMENFDPVGVHTGESIVVAPSQTLNDDEYFKLREMALKVANEFGIVGECNIQYALHPNTNEFYIIEINARLSRSSALASKATGYPLAYIASKLSLGYSLLELKNVVTSSTSAMFEPSLDYCVVKIPRWDLNKFDNVDTTIGTAMKSVGEVMSIGATFEEALMKGLRMVGLGGDIDRYLRGFRNKEKSLETVYTLRVIDLLFEGDPDRKTGISEWFLEKLANIKNFVDEMYSKRDITRDGLLLAKKFGFSDHQLSVLLSSTESFIKSLRIKWSIYPKIKRIDTVAGEFPCQTNYMYLTYNAEFDEIKLGSKEVLLIIGSGVYRIGSSVEFDWCSVSCVRTCSQLGYKTLMLNYNPETVSTDYDTPDYLLFDEISVEIVVDLWKRGFVSGVIVSVGGQESNNIVMGLDKAGVKIIGTDAKMIDNAENRYKFSRSLDAIAVDQPEWKELTSIDAAIEFCNKVSYPCLIRPSYVLSGAAMNVAFDDNELQVYLGGAIKVSGDHPVVISKFIVDAKEIEVDAVAKGGEPIVIAVSEHIENAGVHSGDASLVCPPQDLTEKTLEMVHESVRKIAKKLNINGPFNIQFIAKDDEIKVIECNLRSSRSFPFVSKVYDINLIDIATKVMLGVWNDTITLKSTAIGVKVSQFSFKRLPGADCVLGVEMKSTGEVATFGTTREMAYLKSLLATGYTIPPKGTKILISVGSMRYKNEMLDSVRALSLLEYDLYGTSGTADFYKEHGISLKKVSWAQITRFMNENDISFVFNISMLDRLKLMANDKSHGYILRMQAIRKGVPLLTDVKASRLFIRAIQTWSGVNINLSVDVKSGEGMVSLPELIEPQQWQHTNILSVSQFTRDDLKLLFMRATSMMTDGYQKSLDGKIIGLFFQEPSTRTECSFSSAIKRLGGDIVKVDRENSSLQKGETIEDTLRCLEQYCDGIIVRGSNGIIEKCAGLHVNIINAGEGSGEHPTQALLDLMTIREERGTITELTITIVGDLKNGRTVHSLVMLLCLYNVRKINYVPYHTDLHIPEEIWKYVAEHGIQQENVKIESVIEKTDVLYVTRLQKERIDGDACTYTNIKITPTLIAKAKENMIIMHPLPRNDEIDKTLDTDPRAVYFKQMKYGLYVRMALLELIYS